MIRSKKRIKRDYSGCFACALIAIACLSGCISDSSRAQRLIRWEPDIRPNERMPWFHAGAMKEPVGSDASVSKTGSIEMVQESPPVSPVGDNVGVLQYGDRITVSLRGIPVPEDINEVIDTEGMITLPYISRVKLVGLSTSNAEKLIEKAYKDGGIYPQINVILVSLVEGSYIVLGEVRKPSKYPIIGEVTLLGVISQSGGWTPFAKKTKVQIIRGGKSLYFNAVKIEKNEDEDPIIQSNDKIVVPRRWI